MLRKFVICLVVLQAVSSAKLPSKFKLLQCSKNDPEISKCIWSGLEKARPHLIAGIRELAIPPIDPFEIPFVSVNRTLNELISINSVLKNVRTEGMGNYIIDDLNFDPESLIGEIKYTLPWVYLEMEYDVSGQLLTIPLQSRGFFKGNFTDTQMGVKATLKRYQKDGETFLRVDKISVKGQVGDGWVKLIAKNPELQFGADLISNFFNSNPRTVFDAVNPIFVEFSGDLFKALGNQVLGEMAESELFSE